MSTSDQVDYKHGKYKHKFIYAPQVKCSLRCNHFKVTINVRGHLLLDCNQIWRKNTENRDETKFQRFSSCLCFSTPISTKCTIAQRCYMEVFHTEFYHNLTSVENTDQITVMPFSTSSIAPIFMQHQHKVQSFCTELKPCQQRNINSRSINSFMPSKWSTAFTAHILTKLTTVWHPVNNSTAEFYKNPSNGWLAGTRSWLGVNSTYHAPFFVS